MMTAREFVFALHIPAFNDYRLATAKITGSGSSDYIVSLLSYPSEIGYEVAILDKLVKGGELSFVVGEGARGSMTALASVLARYDNLAAAKLTQNLSATDTTIFTDATSGSLAGATIYLGTEVIEVGIHGGAGDYSCTRGALSSVAQSHRSLENGGDGEIFVTLQNLVGREVRFLRVPKSGSTADEVVLWRGAVTRRPRVSRQEIHITARHLGSLLEASSIMGRRTWRGESYASANRRFMGFRGKAQSDQLESLAPSGSGRVYDTHPSMPLAGITGDVNTQEFLLCIDGNFVVRATWQLGGDGYTQVVHPTFNPSTRLLPPLLAAGIDLSESLDGALPCWELVMLRPDSPVGSGQPSLRRFNNTAASLSTNPITFLRQILTTTTGGENGLDDLGVPTIGLGFNADYLDASVWDTFASRYSNVSIANLVLNRDDEPDTFKDIINKVLGPLHVALGPGRNGWTLISYRDTANPFDVASGVSQALTLASTVGIVDNPSAMDFNDDAALDRVEVTALRAGASPLNERTATYNSINAFRLSRFPWSRANLIQIDATAYSQDEMFGALVSWRIAQIYKRPPPIITLRVEYESDAYPGELVTLTHPDVWNSDGTLGVVNMAALVIGRKLNLNVEQFMTVDLTLALTGALVPKPALIANSAEVVSFTPGSSSGSGSDELVVLRSRFKTSGSLPLHPDGEPWPVSGGPLAIARISIFDSTLAATSNNNVLISAYAANTPVAGQDTFYAASGAFVATLPVAGDIARNAAISFGSNTDDQLNFAYLGPATGNTFATGETLYNFCSDVVPRQGDSNFATDWYTIDDDSVQVNEPLDEALLMRIAANVQQALDERMGCTSFSYDAAQPAQLPGFVGDFGILSAWYLAESASELRLRARVIVDARPVQLYATLYGVNGALTGEHSLQTVAAAFDGFVDFTITGLDNLSGVVYPVLCSRLDSRGVGVTIKGADIQHLSSLGAYLPNAITPPAGNLILEWDRSAIPPAVANELDGGAVAGAFNVLTYTSTSGLSAEPNYTGTLDGQYIYLYPRVSTTAAQAVNTLRGAAESLPVRLRETGTASVYSVEIREAANVMSGEPIALYRAGMEAASVTMASLSAKMEWCAKNRTSVLGAGPALAPMTHVRRWPEGIPAGSRPAYSFGQSGYTGFPTSPIDATTTDPDFICVWSCTPNLAENATGISGTRYQEFAPVSGSPTNAATVEVAGIMGAYTRTGEAGDIDVEVKLRALYVGRGYGTNVIESDITRLSVPRSAAGTFVLPREDMMSRAGDHYGDLPYLRRFIKQSPMLNWSGEGKWLSANSCAALYPVAADASRRGVGNLGMTEFRLELEVDPMFPSTLYALQVVVRARGATPDANSYPGFGVAGADTDSQYTGEEMLCVPAAVAWIQRAPLS